MGVKMWIAGGGVALLGIVPLATLSKTPYRVPIQTAQNYSELGSPEGSGVAEDLSLALDSSENVASSDDSGSEVISPRSGNSTSPSREATNPKILKMFTDPNPEKQRPAPKTTPFDFEKCQEVGGEDGKEKQLMCSGNDEKFSKQEDLLDHYLKNLLQRQESQDSVPWHFKDVEDPSSSIT